MCVFPLMESVVYCVRSDGGLVADARFMLENHLDKIDDVPLECKPAPKVVHSRTPRTTARARIIRLVVHFE